MLSDYSELYKIESIAIHNLLKTKIPLSKYNALKEGMLDYEQPINLFSLNLIVDDIEIMSKLSSKQFNNLNKDKIKGYTQKLINDLDVIIQNHEKDEKILRRKLSQTTRKTESNIDYDQIRKKESLERDKLNFKYKLEYNLNHKIDAIILKNELLKLIPTYKPQIEVIDHFYKDTNFYDIPKIKNDLEEMMELIK